MLQLFDLNADRRIGKAFDMFQIGGELLCKRLIQFCKRNVFYFVFPFNTPPKKKSRRSV